MSKDSLVEILADLKEEEALEIVKKKMEAGEDPLKIIEMCRNAVEIVGKRFENSEYFLPDLIMAGEILRKITEIVKPKMVSNVKHIGTVVLGTVEGDIHDIGKDVVKFILDANGFEVYDLGVDVPPEKFVEKIKEVKPKNKFR